MGLLIKEFSPSQKDDILEVKKEISLLDKMEEIKEIVCKGECIKFSEIFAKCQSKLELIVTFLALLELIRRKVVKIFQEMPFSEIWLSKV